MNSSIPSAYGQYSKARRRKKLRLHKYLSPIKPEIKQWNCISGSLTSDKFEAINILNVAQPTSSGSSKGSWELIPFHWPYQGYSEDDRIGRKFSLKWILFRGYIRVSDSLAMKCNYKLILIKGQQSYADMHEFLNDNYFNYQYPTSWENGSHTFSSVSERRDYGHHNFFKLFKNVSNQSGFKTNVKVLASGTFTPDGGFPGPRFTTTMGSNPSVNLEFGGLSGNDIPNKAYYPFNVRLTCNDNIDAGVDSYYLALITDQPLGHKCSALGSESSIVASDAQFDFNFFTIGYYLDA